ncbi:MAG: PAS domain-containing protein [Desulfobacterales bacterium]|nr:PAS domain-containing protein [Desulfobacterales bacterium]
MKTRQPTNTLVHYVGIGASAGGLEAIEAFFSKMPEESNLAFIVIQHLSPDYKSLMVELLSKKTRIPVHRSVDGMKVEPNNIYMIPPKKNLTIFHGRLVLKEKDAAQGINLPIDIFLRSLSEDKAERAVAVILSGTGSDGTRGVRAIKEQGGMVMVQDETSCKFNGMPRAAISTGVADFILPAGDMAGQLMAYVGHPYVIGQKPNQILLQDENGLTRIFAELREKTKVDFTYYKPSTIVRRIERRMTVNQIEQLSDYVRHLQKFPAEVMTLYKELLIGVTSFFRNADAMKELMEKSMTELIERAKNREIRFWVTACSTGEEAYTIAILAKEAMESLGVAREIKIFATDLDRDAVILAGNGIYPESIAADLTPKMLGKYFYKKEENYRVARQIREMVVFAQHNLVKDPPFTKIDMISCRNLLIYLQPILQQKVMEMFNFSLNPDGILFLGNSETVGDMTAWFETVHQKHKIYRSTGKQPVFKSHPEAKQPEKISPYQKPVPYSFRETFSRFKHLENSNMMGRYLSVLENNFLPLSIIVNTRMDILHVFGEARGFLKIPSGKTEFNVNKMAVKDLSIPLATGIQRVFKSREELIYSNIKMVQSNVSKKINLHIIPLPDKKDHEQLVAVFFEEIQQDPIKEESAVKAYDIEKDVRQRIRDLEQELQFSNEHLQATIEELETSNEELQATNEELLASNEELQSTNQELQSTNEELFTVNAEYQNKIIELTEMNNDVENLLTGAGIEILILDDNNEIRKNSPHLNRIFNILDKDVGRPINHLSHNIIDFDLIKSIKQVQKTNKLSYFKRKLNDGSDYEIRILPYYIGPDAFAGTVLTFVNISEFEKIKQEVECGRQHREQKNHIPSGIFLFNRSPENELVLEHMTPGEAPDTRFEKKARPGTPIHEIWPEMESGPHKKQISDFLKQRRSCLSIKTGDSKSENRIGSRWLIFSLPGKKVAVIHELEQIFEA